MKREAEPELMNARNQVMAYAAGDFSLGEERFIGFISQFLRKKGISLSSDDLIVDLGCGPGNITERLSRQWPLSKVIGIDGSQEMILRAEKNKELNKLKLKSTEKIRYICADIKKIKLMEITAKKQIALLVSNSLIHHIANIDDFFLCLKKLSTKATVNFHKDLRRPDNKEIALELKKKCAQKYNKILTNDYYASLKASYQKDELKQIIKRNHIDSLDVLEENNEYLIIYGNV